MYACIYMMYVWVRVTFISSFHHVSRSPMLSMLCRVYVYILGCSWSSLESKAGQGTSKRAPDTCPARLVVNFPQISIIDPPFRDDTVLRIVCTQPRPTKAWLTTLWFISTRVLRPALFTPPRTQPCNRKSGSKALKSPRKHYNPQCRLNFNEFWCFVVFVLHRFPYDAEDLANGSGSNNLIVKRLLYKPTR